jgi:hypothetical protein
MEVEMRIISGFRAAVAFVALTAACESISKAPVMTAPDYEPLALRRPEVSFRLSDAERAKVAAGFDVGALERLLGMIRPDMREEVLRHFQPGEPGDRKRGALTEFTEPALQVVLEEVWAPMWEDAPDQALEEGWYFYPGREIARQRRELRKRAEAREGRTP